MAWNSQTLANKSIVSPGDLTATFQKYPFPFAAGYQSGGGAYPYEYVLEYYAAFQNNTLRWYTKYTQKSGNITAEKQQQLTSKLMAASMAQQTSTPYTLTWNSTGEVCKAWTLEELSALAFAIDARVTALVTYQQTQEVAMRDAENMEALEAIVVDYDSVGAAA